MKRTALVTAIAGLALALAGCSSPSTPPTPAAVAASAGCTGFQVESGFELFVREKGTCQLGTAKITIDTFNNTSGRDGWLKIAKSFGGVYGHGKLWVIYTINGDATAAVTQATKAAGGVAG